MIRHAGLVAVRRDRLWVGALIEGPSGSGKSDLALRAMATGLRLVADDRVLVWASGGFLYGRAPDRLHGLIEVRGHGVTEAPALRFCRIVGLLRLGKAERMPEATTEAVIGVLLPVMRADPFEASAPAKLSRAIGAFDAASKRRI